MAFFNGWPWTQFQEQNLDWLIKKVKYLETQIGSTAETEYDGSHIHFISKTSDPYSLTKDDLLVINDGNDHIMNNTLSCDVLFISGTLSGDVYIDGKIYAGRQQIFGTITDMNINPENNPVGYPEYYKDFYSDTAIGINECILTFLQTSLAAKDYHIYSTIHINLSHRKLFGEQINQGYYNGLSDNAGTRIIAHSCNGIIIGDENGTFNVSTIEISDLSLTTDADFSLEYAGIHLYCIRAAYIHDVTVSNFKRGYKIENILYSHINKCRYLCNKASNNNAVIAAMYLVLGDPVPNSISSISSLYVTDFDANFANQNRYNYGILSTGNKPIADFIVDKFNSVAAGTGVYIKSDASALQQNLEFTNCCFDNNGEDGIRLDGAIRANINQCHVTVGSWGSGVTKHCIYLQNGGDLGSVRMVGSSIKSADGSTENAYGLRAVGCSNMYIEASCTGFKYPALITNGEGNEIVLSIINKANIADAIVLDGTSHSIVRSSVVSESGYGAGNGVRIANGSYNQVDVTKLVDVTNKMVIGGTVQTTPFTALTNNNVMVGIN